MKIITLLVGLLWMAAAMAETITDGDPHTSNTYLILGTLWIMWAEFKD